MGKIKIKKPTGEELLNIVSAFSVDGNSFVILDSEKTGSMGLPIIYVSKLNNDKLEKINDDNEWEKAKSYLKGIINGTNFLYLKLGDTINADEAYYRPLTLPAASFDLIKSRYVVKEDASSDSAESGALILDANNSIENVPVSENQEAPKENIIPAEVQQPAVTINETLNQTPVTQASVPNFAEEGIPSVPKVEIVPEEPIIPSVNASSNNEISSIPIMPGTPESTNQEVVNPANIPAINNKPETQSAPKEPNLLNQNFDSDKETFMKACENMFDAIISKYQRSLADLEKREQILKQKEKEIDEKLSNANEHLANAEAREAVANIAHDNAKKVMDLASMMPVNPEATETGVI